MSPIIEDKVRQLGVKTETTPAERRKARLQWGLAFGMLIIFGLTICFTIAMVTLDGFGKIYVPDAILNSLIGATIAETGGMLILILQSVFGGSQPQQ